mmetsp:Transcript_102634/g.294061  ORF Transcript_102634/g.294061 Transcript_102634/m.294061 type:complete len:219 (-) Transcript_102634:273-929(-)
MYGLPSTHSCIMRARMPICAARPLLSSMARFWSFCSGENLSQPKSMKPLRKSPGNSPRPVTSRMTRISRAPQKRTICQKPAAGSLEKAARPVGTSAKASSFELEIMPGRRMPFEVTMWPRTASIDTRPCLSSTLRRRSKRSWSTFSTRPIGSQKPSGFCAPSSASYDMDIDDLTAARWPTGAPMKAEAPTRAREATTRRNMVVAAKGFRRTEMAGVVW